MKTAVSIPAATFEAAEKVAKRLGIPRSRLYAHAIERYVSEVEGSDVTKILNRVYGEESVEPDPVLAAMQWAAIARDRW